MNLSEAMNIGRNALIASSRGSQVAAQNLANATTPGYTRRTVELESIPMALGGGVRAGNVTRAVDPYLERRGLGARSYSGEAEAKVKTLAVVDTVFADGQGSVGDALDAFDSALTDLSVSPQSVPTRQVVLARADDLAKAFTRAQDALGQARTDANERITSDVKDVNIKLDRIGELNKQIVAGKNSHEDVGDLEDQRDELIRGVSDALPVQVLNDASGAVAVVLSGSRDLVSVDSQVHHLVTTLDSTSGAVTISRDTAGAMEDITSFFTTGSIGGTISARDGALLDAQNSLDQLAYDISTAYNTQHAAGVDLTGATGRNLFNAPATVTGAAKNFGVSADVAGQPRNIAAAQAATSLPGDNRNALALVGLHDAKLALGGTATAQQSFSFMVAAAGGAARAAQDQSEYAESSVTQIEALRQSYAGVSTDEEMMNIMKFQRSYQAALRVVETADQMLQSLLNMRAG
ncbi:MAG TPA: flagellar hook-associated protein FlgK [Polyangiales bacterium]|nr:flagellar hook-associated protein FlgK [Polyangiales bacterium]